MKELLNNGQVLGREEMKKLMAGSGGGQECNCLYCYHDSGAFMTMPTANCSADPNDTCRSLWYGSGNYGYC